MTIRSRRKLKTNYKSLRVLTNADENIASNCIYLSLRVGSLPNFSERRCMAEGYLRVIVSTTKTILCVVCTYLRIRIWSNFGIVYSTTQSGTIRCKVFTQSVNDYMLFRGYKNVATNCSFLPFRVRSTCFVVLPFRVRSTCFVVCSSTQRGTSRCKTTKTLQRIVPTCLIAYSSTQRGASRCKILCKDSVWLNVL